eukprot:COSAG01_NODE_709_length_14119_cov_107.401213_13_plen_69_part_00
MPAAGGGLKPTGQSGKMLMDEAALLGYGSNGTMVFKGTWGGQQVLFPMIRTDDELHRVVGESQSLIPF